MSSYELFRGGEVQYTISHTTPHEPYVILVPPHTTGTITVSIELSTETTEAHVIILQWVCHGRIRIMTQQRHIGRATQSSTDVRAVVGPEGESIYDGLIALTTGNSSAAQAHRALMIADSAHAQATPALEVLTNDVQCSHASAIGPVDRQMLTSCMARGISLDEAQLLIARGILRDALPHNHPAQKVISSWICHR